MAEYQFTYFYREFVHGALDNLVNDDWKHLKEELDEGRSCQTTGPTKVRSKGLEMA